jgi:hypothetical protein
LDIGLDRYKQLCDMGCCQTFCIWDVAGNTNPYPFPIPQNFMESIILWGFTMDIHLPCPIIYLEGPSTTPSHAHPIYYHTRMRLLLGKKLQHFTWRVAVRSGFVGACLCF